MTSLDPQHGDVANDEDELHDVFEIVDFSTATPWEKLIHDAEQIFRDWDLGVLGCEPLQEHQLQKHNSVEVTLAGRTFRISYNACARKAIAPVSKDQLRRLDTSFHGEGPDALRWMLTSNFDFDPEVHILHSRLGWPAFVLIEAVQNEYSNKVSMSEARMLLGALVIAATNANVEIPLFAQTRESKDHVYIGQCSGIGWTVHMDGTKLPGVPKQCENISGLLNIFHSKVHMPLTSKSYISVKFTYTVRNLFQDWARSIEGSVKKKKKKSSKAISRFTSSLVFPFGLSNESLDSISFACAWPHFREDVLLDNDVHSELLPTNAPMWWLSLTRTVDKPEGLLEKLLRGFALLTQMDVSIRSFLGDGAYIDTEMDEESKPASGKDVLRALAQPSKVISDDIVKTSRELSAKLNSVVVKTVRTVRSSEKSSRELSTAEMDELLGHLFIKTDDWDPEAGSIFKTNPCKWCPNNGLLYNLARYLATVCANAGGVPTVAYVWSEFVMEIRWHWENLRPLPRLETVQQPNMNDCLLQQKLDLVNCCIHRQIARNKLRMSTSSDGGIDNSSNCVTERRNVKSTKNNRSIEEDEEEDGDDDDDEFFLCPEDEEGAMERLKQMKLEEETAGIEEKEPPKPLGVLKEHDSLKLLDGTVLNIPATQETGPITEDMLHARLKEMTEMGNSAEASEKRMQLQSLQLRSDVEAFKAANPTAVLEDFIRWHSPRDWVKNEETGDYELSSRMADPKCIWHTIWEQSAPIPVKLQRALFDTTTEVEKAIQYFENISFQDMSRQLFPSLIESVFHNQTDNLETVCAPSYLKERLESLKYLTNGLGYDLDEDVDRYEDIISQLSYVEREVGTFMAIFSQLGKGTEDLCGEVLQKGRCMVLKQSHRSQVLDYFSSAHPEDMGGGVLSDPQQREFIIRGTHSDCAHRMYVSLKEDETNICGAFTSSTTNLL